MSEKNYPARGKQNLDARQQEALEHVARADGRWREAKRTAMLELRKLVQERIDLHAAQRDEAVWEAIELGVPKSRIGREGLGTTSPNAVYEILDRITQKLQITNVELALKPVAKYQWSEKFTLQNGFEIWFLMVDGDDHVSTVPEYRKDETLEHPGYIYMHYGSKWQWVGTKPNAEALAWAEENKPA